MRHALTPLETVNALVIEPSAAFGVGTIPDLAILRMRSGTPDWSLTLDKIVSGCLVLGFRKVALELEGIEISTPFEIACIASAWHLLVDADGTLFICGMSRPARESLAALSESRQFNLFDDLDTGIDWLETGFARELAQGFPRTARCTECGTEGTVTRRGDHVCDECGMTYFVTERGELPY